jgi:hypothetical protein
MMKIFNFALTMLLSLSLFLPFGYPVWAATETETLNGVGIDTRPSGGGWTVTYVGGADYTVLNSNDDATSYKNYNYVFFGSGFGSFDESFDTTSFTSAYSTINSVTATARVYAHSLGPDTNNSVYYRTADGSYYGTNVVTTADTWTTVSHTWTTNPATGVAWVPADINNEEFGFHCQVRDSAAAYTRVSFLSVVVDYTAPIAPTVTTSAASSIAATSAIMNGAVTDDGDDTIDYYGFVWDTSDKGDGGNVDPATPPGTWSHGWKSAVGDYGENTFAHSTGATLTKGTTYYCRAAAHNSTGWDYGSAVSFTTVGDPTISTVAASSIASTAARLNSNLTFDGNVLTGEDCTVTFVYKSGTGYANYAAILGAGGTETAVAGTFNTGELPYLDVSSLAVATTYSFAVKAVNSTSTNAYGTVLTFTTESGVYVPTNLTAIPSSTSVSVAWTKGVGSQYTLVRYSTATYPVLTTDGLLAYLGTGNSDQITGLDEGTNIYITAWGLTGATYSATGATTMCTTLAYDPTVSNDPEVPAAGAWWMQTPSTAKSGSIPFMGTIVQKNADAYKMPAAMIWYIIWIVVGVGLGIWIYNKSSNNIPMSAGAEAIWFGIGTTLEITMGLVAVGFAIIAVGFLVYGNRH